MIDIKRLFDLLVSLLISPIGLVLCVVFGLLFLIVNRENPLFVQRRMGRHGEYFQLYKLRTMSSATKDVPTHKINSSEISMLGRIMRAIKVDEIPQLYNVIRGEMSLVGPRPCLPSQHKLITERLKLGVYEVRPGITGYAQVKGLDMSLPEKLACVDSEYIQQKTLLLDLKLLLQTVLGKGSGDKTVKAS